MHNLCFLSAMTSAEVAAWVQGVGAIVAVVAAMIISRLQFVNDRSLQAEERRSARIDLGQTVLAVAKAAVGVAAYAAAELSNRQAVHDIAEFEKHFDAPALSHMEDAINAIPFHVLASSLVPYVMMLSSAVRQVRELSEKAIAHHREMDAAQFQELFQSMSRLQQSLKLTISDIETGIGKL